MDNSLISSNKILFQFDNARLGRFHYYLMLLTLFCWVLAAYGVTIIGFMMPSLNKEWLVPANGLGLLASIGMAGMFIGSIVVGTLSDRFGRRKIMAWSLFYLGVLFIASAKAWNFNSLLVMRFYMGLGLGAILPVSSTIVTEFSPSKYRGAMAVLMTTCWGLGGTLAALVGYNLILKHGWRPAMLFGGLALIISPMVRFLLPESIRFLLDKGREEDAVKEFSRIHLQSTAPTTPPISENKQRTVAVDNQTGGIWSAGFARITGSLWLFWISLNFVYQGAFVWLPTLLATTKLSTGRSFLLTMIISLGQLPGSLIAAYLADRFSRRKLIIISQVLLSTTAFLFGLSRNDIWILVMGIMLMVFNGMSWGFAWPFSSELYPTRMRVSATGWAAGIGRLGGVPAPIIIAGVMQAGGSILHVFSILAFMPFVTALVLSRLRVDTTGKTLEDISPG